MKENNLLPISLIFGVVLISLLLYTYAGKDSPPATSTNITTKMITDNIYLQPEYINVSKTFYVDHCTTQTVCNSTCNNFTSCTYTSYIGTWWQETGDSLITYKTYKIWASQLNLACDSDFHSIICDSCEDGNCNGICEAGESCVQLTNNTIYIHANQVLSDKYTRKLNQIGLTVVLN